MVIDHGEHGTFRTRIEKVDAPRYLAYRWASAYPGEDAADTNSTLVEFTLDPVDPQHTRLTLVESGFTTQVIPPERESTAGYESHSLGWPEVLAHLRRRAELQDA